MCIMYLMIILVTSFTNIFISAIFAWSNGSQLLYKILFCENCFYMLSLMLLVWALKDLFSHSLSLVMCLAFAVYEVVCAYFRDIVDFFGYQHNTSTGKQAVLLSSLHIRKIRKIHATKLRGGRRGVGRSPPPHWSGLPSPSCRAVPATCRVSVSRQCGWQ